MNNTVENTVKSADYKQGFADAQSAQAQESAALAELQREKAAVKILREDLADREALAEVTAIGGNYCEAVTETFAEFTAAEFAAFGETCGKALALETRKAWTRFAVAGVQNFNDADKRATKVAALLDPIADRAAKRAKQAQKGASV